MVVLLSNSSSDTINSLQYGIGGAVISISGLMLIYEVLMIVLSFIKEVNHSARLLAVYINNNNFFSLMIIM